MSATWLDILGGVTIHLQLCNQHGQGFWSKYCHSCYSFHVKRSRQFWLCSAF